MVLSVNSQISVKESAFDNLYCKSLFEYNYSLKKIEMKIHRIIKTKNKNKFKSFLLPLEFRAI